MSLRTYTARFRRFIDSKPVVAILCGIIALLFVLVIFEAGVLFGMHAERRSYRWGEDYARNFGGPAEGFIPGPGSAPNGHGAFGRIASTSFPTFVIADPSRPEEKVRINEKTIIRNGSQVASSSALTVGTYVVVLGAPGEEGVIDANLIRIMPAPPEGRAAGSQR